MPPYWVSQANYLLFHSAAEFFSIIVALAIFVVYWNTRYLVPNDGFYLYVGIAFVYIALIDLVHTLAYKGMGVFPDATANLPTQLWIAARYLQAVTLVLAPVCRGRKPKQTLILTIYSVALVVLFLSLTVWPIFPTCYIEGVGLTPFKKVSEYIISLLLLGALVQLSRRRAAFDPLVHRYLIWSVIATIGSELAFTFYVSVYGFSNFVGHVLKIAAFFLIYKAFIEHSLARPFAVLFRDLKASEVALQESNRSLESALDDLQRTREQAIRQERLAAVGQLAAGLAHEYNNMMAAVILFSDLMLRTSKLDASDREKLRLIRDQGQRAADLTQQILDLSRKAILRRERTDLGHLLARLTLLLMQTLPQNIQVELTQGTDDYTVDVDPTRLQQALMNLAVNARDAMPDGGRLDFELSRVTRLPAGAAEGAARDWVQLRVRDTGGGIPEEVWPHIFEPFFTTKEVGQGTGLGLAQVRGVVEQHGGEIEIETEVGTGTVVTLSLPAALARTVRPAEPAGALSEELVHGRGELILLVEDAPDVRQALADSLEALNYRVLAVENGRQALEAFSERGREISVALTDLVMPDLGGRELAQELNQRAPDLPIVVLTGYPLDRGEAEGFQSISVAGWLQKPVNLADLGRTLARAVADASQGAG